jgi:hypothetical protein
MSIMPQPVLQGFVPNLIFDFAYMSTNVPGNTEEPSRLSLYMVHTEHAPPGAMVRFTTPHLRQDSQLHGSWTVLIPQEMPTSVTSLIMFEVVFHFKGAGQRMKRKLFRRARNTADMFVSLEDAPSAFHTVLTSWYDQ